MTDQQNEQIVEQAYHSRWVAEHRNHCNDCAEGYADWLIENEAEYEEA